MLNEKTNYYLYSFQINGEKENFEANARLEEGKIIFEFTVSKEIQAELVKQFNKLG